MLPRKRSQAFSRGLDQEQMLMRRFLGSVLLVSIFLCTALAGSDAQTNLRQIRAAIQEQRLNWVAGETSVSGLSLEEKRRLCGFRPERERIAAPSALLQAPFRAPFPATFDWRDNPVGTDWMAPVRNQGGCGSCVAFAVVGALEACENINMFGAPRPEYDLSEQFLFSCGGGSCKDGWTFGPAMEFLKTTGVTDESCYPYSSGDGYDYPCDGRCADWPDRVVTISDYMVLSGQTSPLDDVLKSYVQAQPVVCAMDVYESFYSYDSGIYERLTVDELRGSHAVVIVGWDDTTSPPCWICKNSWGTGWGESGYFRIKRRDSKVGSYAFFIEYESTSPPPPEVGSLAPIGVVVLVSGFLISAVVIWRKKVM
jgi:C1A family cysteine protease